MAGKLRHGLHTVLGDAAEGVSQITERFGRERHPEWYAEQRERFARTWALLDLIGSREPKQLAAVRINLSEQLVKAAAPVRYSRVTWHAGTPENKDFMDTRSESHSQRNGRARTSHGRSFLKSFYSRSTMVWQVNEPSCE
jgi:hypothetical protein